MSDLIKAPLPRAHRVSREVADALIEEAFAAFWAEWPRKVAKAEAKKAFAALARAGRLPSLDALVMAIRAQSRQPQWREDAGRFIPYPATWLRQERWQDEVPGVSLPTELSSPLPVLTDTAEAKPDGELARLFARGQAYDRIERAVAAGAMPTQADLALVGRDHLLAACRRFGTRPDDLEVTP